MTTIRRSVLHEAIDDLPDKALVELADYITFLNWKSQKQSRKRSVQRSHPKIAAQSEAKTAQTPPYRPVAFPAGSASGFDFSPEYIAEGRRELWGRLREQD